MWHYRFINVAPITSGIQDLVIFYVDLTALEPNDHEELLNANLGQSNLVVSEASDFLVTHECSYQGSKIFKILSFGIYVIH